MNEIAQLFDTFNELQELEKLNSIKTELEREQRRIDGKNGQLPQKKETLETLTLGIKNVDEKNLVQVEYFQLLKGDLPLKEWDKRDISVQMTTKELYLNDLRQLYDFVKNFVEFLKAQTNKEIQKYVENTQLLSDTIVSFNFLNEYESIKELKKKEKKLRTLKSVLTRDNLQKHIESFPHTDLEQFVDLEFDLEVIKDKFKLLKDYKQNANDLSSILQELNTTRDKLVQHFKKINHYELGKQENCPLCGHDWGSYHELLASIKSKRDAFQKHYDTSASKYEKELNLLFVEHLDPINNWINGYLGESNNIIDEAFFEQLKESIKRIQNTRQFIEWCSKESIDITAFTNQNKKFVSNLEEKKEELANFILGKKQHVKQGYSEFDEKSLVFDSLYQELFQGIEEEVRNIRLSDIESKAKYINYQYYHRSSESINKLNQDITKLESKLGNIEKGITKIKRITEIYNQKISHHWQHILRDIEIPFYIYSGKILQDYQRGLGMFIQESEGEGAKSIKFVSNSNSDHDAVNYLSSGQLSGLVIAFTLALNKVYGNKTMDILLIDDPVQTMDEINMASFVELLRNEFKHKQIFLSTHEDDTSRFIRYKFRKYNLHTLRLNVKDKLYLDTENKEMQ